jgi:hypothetical protein
MEIGKRVKYVNNVLNDVSSSNNSYSNSNSSSNSNMLKKINKVMIPEIYVFTVVNEIVFLQMKSICLVSRLWQIQLSSDLHKANSVALL